jgi:hypothetical protein
VTGAATGFLSWLTRRMLGTEGGSIGIKTILTCRVALASLVDCMELGVRGKRGEVQCSIARGWRAIMYSRDLECLVDRLQK